MAAYHSSFSAPPSGPHTDLAHPDLSVGTGATVERGTTGLHRRNREDGDEAQAQRQLTAARLFLRLQTDQGFSPGFVPC